MDAANQLQIFFHGKIGCHGGFLGRITKQAKVQPRSPKKYLGAAWTRKGTAIFVSSILSSFVLAEAILNFNLTLFLSYSFTILMGCIFGYMQMNDAEGYWTNEYLIYAMTEEERALALKAEQEALKKLEKQTGTAAGHCASTAEVEVPKQKEKEIGGTAAGHCASTAEVEVPHGGIQSA